MNLPNQFQLFIRTNYIHFYEINLQCKNSVTTTKGKVKVHRNIVNFVYLNLDNGPYFEAIYPDLAQWHPMEMN